MKSATAFSNSQKDFNTPRVFWCLSASIRNPSTRIHGYRIHQYLLAERWKSKILVQPSRMISDIPLSIMDLLEINLFKKNDVVIFQKVSGNETVNFINKLTESGISTVYVDCDLPLKLMQAKASTCVVCSSNYLVDQYKMQGLSKVFFIPDALEYTHYHEKLQLHANTSLRCVWFGVPTPAKFQQVSDIKNLLKLNLPAWELVTVTNASWSNIKWNLNSAWFEISKFDVAVIPSSLEPWAMAKSANRCIQAMALGLPVVATAIPSYEEVIIDGFNGFLCHSTADWISALNKLSDASVRSKMALNAFHYAKQHFSISQVGPIWEKLFLSLQTNTQPFFKRSKISFYDRFSFKKMRSRSFIRMAIAANRRKLCWGYIKSALFNWPFDKFLFHTIFQIIKLHLKSLFKRN
jgi:hypothetical protein